VEVLAARIRDEWPGRKPSSFGRTHGTPGRWDIGWAWI